MQTDGEGGVGRTDRRRGNRVPKVRNVKEENSKLSTSKVVVSFCFHVILYEKNVKLLNRDAKVHHNCEKVINIKSH